MHATDDLGADLARQRAFLAQRCPPYARLLDLLPELLPEPLLAAAWKDRSFSAWYERPLLLLACLRDDALEEGPAHPLFAAVGPDARAEAADAGRLREALSADRPLWTKLAVRHVQTNETSRSVAWMWVAHLWGRGPLSLVDMGASAGLNLIADALPRIWSRTDGSPLTLDPLPVIRSRTGFDARPIDVTDEEQARWLHACIWPGQRERSERLERAITAWRRAVPRPELVACPAGEVPRHLPRDGRRVLVYQTVVRDYLGADERAAWEAGMRRWIAESPAGSACWVELEHAEPADPRWPVRLVAHVSSGSYELAACEPHPRVLRVDEEAVRAFCHG